MLGILRERLTRAGIKQQSLLRCFDPESKTMLDLQRPGAMIVTKNRKLYFSNHVSDSRQMTR